MAWTPISNTVPQYEEDGVAASGFYIKFYEAGTTTPTAMATDSTGVTTLDKCELNTEGYPKNGSNAVFIPHIDRRYKIALFRNATDADNNNLNNAVWPVDNMEPVLTEGAGEVATIADLRSVEPAQDGQQINLLGHTLPGLGGGTFYFDESDTTSADNNGTIIVTAGGKRWKRKSEGLFLIEDFGAIPGVDAKQAIVDSINSLSYAHTVASHLCSSITSSDITGKPIEIIGKGKGRLTAVNSLSDILFDILDNSVPHITIVGMEIDGYNRIINTGPSSAAISSGMIRIQDNYLHDLRSAAFNLQFLTIEGAICTGNRVANITGNATDIAVAFLIGQAEPADPDATENIIISDNIFENITSLSPTQEVHAAQVLGVRCVISNNIAKNITNTGEKNAEAFYTKCRYSTITGNSIIDGGYSNNGAIVIKGDPSGDSSQSGPAGFGCTVTGNSIIATDNTDDRSMGILLFADKTTCTANYIQGCRDTGIFVGGPKGNNINVSGNIIDDFEGNFAIRSEAQADDVNISDNIINVIGGVSSSVRSIYLKSPGNVTRTNCTVSGNMIRLDSATAASSFSGIEVDVQDSTRIFNKIVIKNNTIDSTGASGVTIRPFYINSAAGGGAIDELFLNGNIVFPRQEGAIVYGGGVIITFAEFLNNKLNDNIKNTSYTMTIGRAFTTYIQDNGSNHTLNLSSAFVGQKFSLINGNSSGTYKMTLTGSSVFRGTPLNNLTVSGIGGLSIECIDAGVWDITSSAAPFAFS